MSEKENLLRNGVLGTNVVNLIEEGGVSEGRDSGQEMVFVEIKLAPAGQTEETVGD